MKQCSLDLYICEYWYLIIIWIKANNYILFCWLWIDRNSIFLPSTLIINILMTPYLNENSKSEIQNLSSRGNSICQHGGTRSKNEKSELLPINVAHHSEILEYIDLFDHSATFFSCFFMKIFIVKKQYSHFANEMNKSFSTDK